MFTFEQYRTKALEYGNLVGTSRNSNERREYQQLQRKFSELADNEQWLADNHHLTLHAPIKNQIKFLNLPADALSDEFLGVHLAESVDLRALGLLYYVLASSTTLGDASRRASRYSAINNEGVQITFRKKHKQISIIFRYIGVARLNDRHQIEFFVVTLLRIRRQLTDRHLSPRNNPAASTSPRKSSIFYAVSEPR